jgi:hypothetical protein
VLGHLLRSTFLSGLLCGSYLFNVPATRWTIGVLDFDSRRGLGIFLSTTASRTALGSTQPPIQWVSGALPLGVERPERDAGHSPPSSAEVKECVDLYLHSPNALSRRGTQLKEAQGQLLV